MAAPIATTSSGFTLFDGDLPKNFSTTSCTFGIRVIPPTKSTSVMSDFGMSASLTHCSHGAMVRLISLSTKFSSCARVTVMSRCLGPLGVAVINAACTFVSVRDDNSILVRSASSFKRCTANLSPIKSIWFSFLNSRHINSRISWSKSSPPSVVSPLVAITSNTPSDKDKMEISKVPPPRSYTATMPSFFGSEVASLPSPYANAAAVGSLITRNTSKPAMAPASLVACRCESLK
mmetsp:Transcript_30065/g.48994  ORF Transcript_30065/g.48994 Transcript_30065/m.48994 type:complete len:234 (+) Transcript_30065:975-1676(+)